MTMTALDPAALRRAFGAFPSGVVAVAARVDGDLVGLAASSFTSVSLEPALVSLSVANGSSTWPVLRRARRLGFDGLDVVDADGGAVLLRDAVTSFECEVRDEIEAGDHTIVVMELEEVRQGSGWPLVFHRSAFARIRESFGGGR
jgi:flavin reductase (DIM6/NTAB) family NADH-FMN oxidoreductase RutF